jgi:hypothetical protein
MLAIRSARVLFLLTLIGAEVPAQGVQLGVGGGVAIPAADYGGTTIDFFNGTRYGFAPGPRLQGKFRAGFDPVTITVQFSWMSFSNSGAAEPGAGTIEHTHTVAALSVGSEIQLDFFRWPFVPYAGFDVGINVFRGRMTFRDVPLVPSGVYGFRGTSRVGVGITGGILLPLGNGLTMDGALQYSMMNLGGESWLDPNLFIDARLDSYTALNDAADPLYRPNDDKHFVARVRSIHSLNLILTLLIDL